MTTVAELMQKHRWCYWLDQSHPEPGHTDRFRVSIVFESVSGHYPTGNEAEHKAPWYWDKATCERMNEERGLSETDTEEIVISSIFHPTS